MGTLITVHTGQSRSQRVHPSKRLKLTLTDQILRPEERVVSIKTSEVEHDGLDALTDQQAVGAHDWVVECREDNALQRQVDLLQTSLAQLTAKYNSEMSALKTALGPPHIRNLAAQALLAAISSLGQDPSAHRFRDLEKQRYQPLTDFAEFLGVRPAIFAVRADRVLTRRNDTVHTGRGKLDDDVAAALRLLDTHPDMRTQFPHECQILDNFEALQIYFNF